MSDINITVDRLLAERRPDRYQLDGGDEWLDDIADEIESLIPEAEAKARAAASRNETCEAAEWIASRMRATGTHFGRDLDLDQ